MRTFVAMGALWLLCSITTLPVSAQNQSWLSDPGQEEAFLSVLHSISSHDLMAYVEEMTADRYRGRLSGTPEYMEVAEWVAGNLKAWGIKPGGDNGSYFQMFDMPYSDIKNAGSLSIRMESGGEELIMEYSFPDDYYPGTNSDSGSV